MSQKIVHLCLALALLMSACDLLSSPIEAAFSTNVSSGGVPLDVLFDASSTRYAGDDPLRYSWDFGDEQRAEGQRVSHTYTEVGVYEVRLRVSTDTAQSSTTAIITVNEEVPPALAFELQSGPFPERLEAGASVNIPLDVVRQGQFAGRIRFELLNSPSGLTHLFSPNDSTAERVVLTLINDGSSLETLYPLMIYAHQGVLDDALTFPLILASDSPGPNVALVLERAHLALDKGGRASITVEIRGDSELIDDINVSVLDVPDGLAAEITKLTEQGQALLSLEALPDVTSQQTVIRIRGEVAGFSQEVSLGLRLRGEVANDGRLSGRVRTPNGLIPVPSSNGSSMLVKQQQPISSVPQQLIVRYRDDIAGRQLNTVRRDHAARFSWQKIRSIGQAELFEVAAHIQVSDVLAALNADPHIAYAEANAYFDLLDLPNDPLLDQQWNLAVSGVPLAWEEEKGRRDVIVAVIDSGVDTDHEDLAANLLPGMDFCANEVGECALIDSDPNPGPFNSNPNLTPEHGTHVSGIIAAVADNELGISGIAPRVRIVPIKVFNSRGSGATLSAIANAMRWAAGLEVEGVASNPHPADILNLSLGGLGTFETLNEIVEELFESGKLVVAAVGNDSASEGLRSPANAPLAIAVGSVGVDLGHSSFSNYNSAGGKKVDFVAAGEDVFSSLPDDGTYVIDGVPYGFLTGTSMATPVVSAVAALLWSQHPELNNEAILALMRQHSYFDPQTMSADQVGAGLIRADSALGFPAPGDSVTIRAQGEFFTFLSDAVVTLDPYGFSSQFVLSDLIVDDYTVQASSFALLSLFGEDRARALSEGTELLIPLAP